MASIPKTGSEKIQRKALKSLEISIMESKRAPVVPNVAVFHFDSDDELID